MSRGSKRDFSLRWKVAGLISLSMLAVLTISTSLGYFRQKEQALANMSLLASQTGQVIEHTLERDMLVSDFDRIQTTFESITEDPRVRTLYLLNTSGTVIFAPDEADIGRQLSNQHESCQPCHQHPPEERPSGIVVRLEDGQDVFRSMHPIENRPVCSGCHDPQEPLIGLLLTDLSISSVEGAVSDELRENILWLVGTVASTALLASLAVDRWVLQRLTKLAGAMEKFGLRGLSNRLPSRPSDEIGRLGAVFNSMADRVERRDRQNRALSAALQRRAEERGMLLRRLLRAQEEERIRVARELHDDLGQSLSSTALDIELGLRGLEQRKNPDQVIMRLKAAHAQIAQASDQMYDLIMGLRPSVLDDLGLLPGLRTLAQRILEPAGINYEMAAYLPEDRLPSAIETALFRILQEAMTNIQKHAQAETVRIRLDVQDYWVLGRISDDGRGFDPRQGATGSNGLGLLGMRERATQLQGTFEIASEPGRGTTVTVRIPLPEEWHD